MKITLAAIVGNEQDVIERFIRSFAPAVDEIVLCRAIGNAKPDTTMEIAAKICDELHKPFCQTTYKNKTPFSHVDDFAAARNEVFYEALCGTECDDDYIIWADTDDVLDHGAAEAIRAAANSGSHDVFIMPYHVRGDKQIVMRERMVKCDTFPKWIYPIHEQLAFKREVSYRIIRDAIFIHNPTPGKPSSEPRNLAILNEQIKDASRNFFYLSQQHFQAGRNNSFVKSATAALACPGLGEIERYELLLQLAQTSGQDSRKLAAEAFAIMPDRREALALLTNYCIVDGDYEKALNMCRKMLDIPKPTKTYWSQNNEWYGWKAQSLFCQCLKLCNKASNDESPINPTFSIIHGTLGRPEKALAIREMWLSSAVDPSRVEYIFGIHSGDEKSLNALKGFPHTVIESTGPNWLGSAANFDTAAGISTGQVIIAAQDDCYPPESWDEKLLEIIGDVSKPAYVAVSDGHRTDRLNVSTILTRAYMEIKAKRDPGESGLCHRGYPSAFPDTENSVRAIQDGAEGICEYIDAPQFVLFHDHPAFNPAMPWDETYDFESNPELYEASRQLFLKRNPNATAETLLRNDGLTESLQKEGAP